MAAAFIPSDRRAARKVASFSRSRERMELPPGAVMTSPFEQEQQPPRRIATRNIPDRSLQRCKSDEVVQAAYDMAVRCHQRGVTNHKTVARLVWATLSSFLLHYTEPALEILYLRGLSLALEGETYAPTEAG